MDLVNPSRRLGLKKDFPKMLQLLRDFVDGKLDTPVKRGRPTNRALWWKQFRDSGKQYEHPKFFRVRPKRAAKR